MPEEGDGGGREVRGELLKGAERVEPEPEGEVRGGPQEGDQEAAAAEGPGTNCIEIGLPGKLILSKRKGLWEVLFSLKWSLRINFPGRPIFIQLPPDQDVDRVGGHQRQDSPHREEEVHRVGEL